MKDIAIYGYGGFGREVACLLQAINQQSQKWNLIGYFDDEYPVGEANRYGKVLGGIDVINAYPNNLSLVIAIASPTVLHKLISVIHNPQISFPNIIAPNVLFFDKETCMMGRGNVISFGGRVSCNVSIGNFNLVNGCTSFGHDVILGDFNVLQPEVRISGETIIGNGNFFGVRSLVLQRLSIGNNVRVGAGSVIVRKTKDGMTYLGNPAKILNF